MNSPIFVVYEIDGIKSVDYSDCFFELKDEIGLAFGTPRELELLAVENKKRTICLR